MDEDSGCNKDEIKQMGRDLVNWIKSTYAGSASIKDRKFSEQFSSGRDMRVVTGEETQVPSGNQHIQCGRLNSAP
ncbi:hypothetical protein L798_13296 [Zootermopsis nevadensis]|uniref:Uncharacterized protein n=1 Tax=Zootermopsis nevadensis TaxID=136037 RepID=A0A067QVC2_ZOONE|nr:hypothetical protein L798_13296 [Zootermopsis nevadensis]